MGSKRKRNARDLEIRLECFTNNEDQRERLISSLKNFYVGTIRNAIGIAEAMDDDGELVTVLVGSGPDGLFPIARCLGVEDLKKYLLPDGNGNYVNELAP